MAQVFSERGSELGTSLAKGFMIDLNTALVQQFLGISVTGLKSVVKPNGVLDRV